MAQPSAASNNGESAAISYGNRNGWLARQRGERNMKEISAAAGGVWRAG
jgi:hypothetical protein